MRLANAVRKYAYATMNSIERTPNSWGDLQTIEKVYVHSLELLAISLGKDWKIINERHRALLTGDCVSLADAGKSSDEIITALLSIKQEIERM